jgi:hypothetical protein
VAKCNHPKNIAAPHGLKGVRGASADHDPANEWKTLIKLIRTELHARSDMDAAAIAIRMARNYLTLHLEGQLPAV